MRHASMCGLLALVLFGLVATPAAGEDASSASYQLLDHALNAGGRPQGGYVAQSEQFKLTVEALADGVVGNGGAGAALSSASYRATAGFVERYTPSSEVEDLRFIDAQTLSWDWSSRALTYDLYRDSVLTLPAAGSCLMPGLTLNQAHDPATPLGGVAWFYLVAGGNWLGEAGPLGSQSDKTPRAAASACP